MVKIPIKVAYVGGTEPCSNQNCDSKSKSSFALEIRIYRDIQLQISECYSIINLLQVIDVYMKVPRFTKRHHTIQVHFSEIFYSLKQFGYQPIKRNECVT